MNRRDGIPATLVLTIVAFCLFEFILQRESGIFREWATSVLSLQWILLAFLALWCSTFLFLTFSLQDLPLAGLLLLASAICLIPTQPLLDVITLLFCITFGKATLALLNVERRIKNEECETSFEIVFPKSIIVNVLVGLVLLLAFSLWWHLDMSDNYYHGPRWMGLWNNPNTYGTLMGSGCVLAVGLREKMKTEDEKGKKWVTIILAISAIMLGVGLVMSYSRGAWLGTAIGLFYLAWNSGHFKWRYVCPFVALVLVATFLLWGRTPDSAPWFIKRADLGRPSAQHRVAGWRAGFEIMRDHPLGVGWDNSIQIYQDHYNPPEDGAAAIATSDYLIIGTELGIPALLCFVAYAVLCLRGKPKNATEEGRIQATCRAGAIVFLFAFWFDGGFFKLPTAAMFWVLLELGSQVAKPFCPNQPAGSTSSAETRGPTS